MSFIYRRKIHFPDTDAAGVVFFAQYLSLCHEAYEEALGAAGIELHAFFKDTGTLVPIAKSEAEYHRPLETGDEVTVSVTPRLLAESTFEIRFEIKRLGPPDKRAGTVRTEHVCIDSKTRTRLPLPEALAAWVGGRGGGGDAAAT